MFGRVWDVRTVNLSSRGDCQELTSELGGLFAAGKQLSVTVAEADETLSPQDVAVGLVVAPTRAPPSRHGRAGVHPSARRLPLLEGPTLVLLALETRRNHGRTLTDAWSTELDELGALAK